MTILPVWDNDKKTILRYVHYGTWTWDELDQAVERAQAMFKSVRHHVDVIIDLRESGMLPDNAYARPRRPVLLAGSANNLLVVLGPTGLAQNYYETARKLYMDARDRDNLAYASILDDARSLLHSPATMRV
jgi:regulator of extracellular matrix RemA (YlzA/DUF370 family)